VFDFPKALSAIADADSRLEQIANQQKITNGLLAMLVLERSFGPDGKSTKFMLSPVEQSTLIALVRTAFTNPVDPS
jgi:hypothetical protein